MIESFKEFNLPQKLMQALTRMQFEKPTPVQQQAIPLALQGRDILGSAQTGTGKTGAFGIPLITRLMEEETSTALIMAPTRELAAQVMAVMQQMIPSPDIKTALLIGGENMSRQFKQLAARPRLVVGTPGRIIDHLTRKTLVLKYAHFLVLDETDRMLDMGFGPQIDKIVAQMPKQRQTMLFSATLPPAIVKVANNYLNSPARIAVGAVTATADKVKQDVVHVPDGKKFEQLLGQLIICDGSMVIFAKTRHGTERLAKKLTDAGHAAAPIHGDLQQKKRDRTIQDFRNEKFRILVATDIAARGLDIPHIAYVINYDLPQVAEDYIHRIGRTARGSKTGTAITLLTHMDMDKWGEIQRLLGGDAAAGQPGAGKKPGGKRVSPGRATAKPWKSKSYGAGLTSDRPGKRRFGKAKAKANAAAPGRADMDFSRRARASDAPRKSRNG